MSAAQMREVDNIVVDKLGISLLQMMENAGGALAELTRIHCCGVLRRRVVVLAGRGGNRGCGMAAACRLAISGAEVCVVLAHPESALDKAPVQQLESIRALGLPLHCAAEAASVLHPWFRDVRFGSLNAAS